eukprot:1238745-Pyramimonas_sp.AAC.1
MSQDKAKQFFPPGTYLWRNNTGGAWCFHQPDLFHRGRCSWAQFGGNSLEALRAICKRAWMRYLEEHRPPPTQCPIPGLLS